MIFSPLLSVFAPNEARPGSNLLGTVSCTSSQRSRAQIQHIRVSLVRLGQLKDDSPEVNRSYARLIPPFLRIGERRTRQDFENAEQITTQSFRPQPSQQGDSNTCTSDFSLLIPAHLPPTTQHPQISISYALRAECICSDHQSYSVHRTLRVSQPIRSVVHVISPAVITFPESPLAVKVRFAELTPGAHMLIPTTLHLSGLRLTPERQCESRWLAPHKMKWEVRQTAIVISSVCVEGDRIPMADASRDESTHVIIHGEHDARGHMQRSRAKVAPSAALDRSQTSVSFGISIPTHTNIANAAPLHISDGYLEHTTLSCHKTDITTSYQERFAVHLEYSVQIDVHFFEDTIVTATGSLVKRKPSWLGYTIICPLKMSEQAASIRPITVLPSYDLAADAPPAYTGNGKV